MRKSLDYRSIDFENISFEGPLEETNLKILGFACDGWVENFKPTYKTF